MSQEQVGEYVLNHGSVSAKDLASVFGVSTMTIHRDLDELEQPGVLRKVRGAAHQEQDTVRIKRAMIAAARRRVLLIDHNKLGKSALHTLAPLGDFDLIVVDSGADRRAVDGLRDCGVPVEVAPI